MFREQSKAESFANQTGGGRLVIHVCIVLVAVVGGWTWQDRGDVHTAAGCAFVGGVWEERR